MRGHDVATEEVLAAWKKKLFCLKTNQKKLLTLPMVILEMVQILLSADQDNFLDLTYSSNLFYVQYLPWLDNIHKMVLNSCPTKMIFSIWLRKMILVSINQIVNEIFILYYPLMKSVLKSYKIATNIK